jgi:antitoxin MazE
MRVAKWGNSLAVRLPKELVESLQLKSGDELEIVATGDRRCEIVKRDRAEEFLEALKQFRFELPSGYKFDRDEANER